MRDISREIIGAAIEVHKVLGGPGLLESVYEDALFHELFLRGIPVNRQVQIPVSYKGLKTRSGLQLDMLVNNEIIIEIKATEKNNPIYTSQLLTYLRLSNLQVGLLINFGYSIVTNGITRVVNNYS